MVATLLGVSLVDPAPAKRRMVCGDRVGGYAVQARGMIDLLVPGAALMEKVREMAAFHAGKPPMAARRIERGSTAMPWRSTVRSCMGVNSFSVPSCRGTMLWWRAPSVRHASDIDERTGCDTMEASGPRHDGWPAVDAARQAQGQDS